MSSSEMVPVVGMFTPHGSPTRVVHTEEQQQLHEMALLPYDEQQQYKQQLRSVDDEQLETYYEFGQQQGQQDQAPLWIDNMVKVASVCNRLVRRNCNLCNVYVDQQVEFEQRQQEQDEERQSLVGHPTTSNNRFFMGSLFDAAQQEQGRSPTERVWNKMQSSLEVEVYRQFLFDEASVGGNHNLEDWMGRGCGKDTTTNNNNPPPSSITTTTKATTQSSSPMKGGENGEGVPLAAAVSEDYDDDMEDDVKSVSLLEGMD